MLYTFYGDDFTGSTDVLEQLASNGVATVLFLEPPTNRHMRQFGEVQAIGIAGDSRSRSPEWMTDNLPKIFAALKSYGAPVNHYKVCSTFDSSPTHGSIGRAIELGQQVFDSEFVPILVAATHLRRYVVFGNLFAAGPDGTILRIDRHPMAHHPVTSMREADLRVHLAAQTNLPIGLIDIVALQERRGEKELDKYLVEGKHLILFDGLDEPTLNAAGELLWKRAEHHPIFCAASSGLTAALVSAWRRSGVLQETQPHISQKAEARPLLVLSGSCSPMTALQIRWSIENDFHGIPIDPTRLADLQSSGFAHIRDQAIASLSSGQNTVIYTALGPSSASISGDKLGSFLGDLLCDLLSATPVRRVLLCGGDTASHAVQQLGLYALTWVGQVQAGAPLCRAFSDDPALDGLELVLKGGQVGTPDFFRVACKA